MNVTNVRAVIAVSDFDAALEWYAQLFGRPADSRPMDGLAEWDLTSTGGLQVFNDAEHAGHTSVTLTAKDLGAQVAEIRDHGIDIGEITTGTAAQFVAITDPEGNAITFASALPSET